VKENPNTPKKVYTGSTKLPLPITTQLLEEESDQHHTAGPENMPKPPPIYIQIEIKWDYKKITIVGRQLQILDHFFIFLLIRFDPWTV
jgi:hypothetical protein